MSIQKKRSAGCALIFRLTNMKFAHNVHRRTSSQWGTKEQVFVAANQNFGRLGSLAAKHVSTRPALSGERFAPLPFTNY